jgi:O-antigen/teichoic acid export membrane protein
MQLTTFFVLISLVGIGTTLKKIIPEFVQRKKKKRIENLIAFGIYSVFIASLIFSLMLIGFSKMSPHILKLTPDVLNLIVFAIIVNSFSDILSAIYYGYQDMRMIFFSTCAGNILMILLTLLSIYLGLDYYGVILAFISSFLVMSIIRFKWKYLKSPRDIQFDRKIIFEYTIPTFLVVVFLAIFNNTHFIILSSLKNADITGLFAVTMKISSMVTLVPSIFSGAAMPITSGLSVSKNAKSRQSFVIKSMFRYSSFIIFPLALFMIVFSKYIILFFSTTEFLEATSILPIMAVGGTILGLGTLFVSSLYAIGNPRRYRDTYLISTVVYLVSSLILTYYYSAMGMAISYLFSAIIFFLLSFYFINEKLDISISVDVIGKIFGGLAAAFLFLFLMKPIIPNIWIAGIFSGLSGLIYLLVLLKLKFFRKEDLNIIDYMIERIPIFKKEMEILKEMFSKFID